MVRLRGLVYVHAQTCDSWAVKSEPTKPVGMQPGPLVSPRAGEMSSFPEGTIFDPEGLTQTPLTERFSGEGRDMSDSDEASLDQMREPGLEPGRLSAQEPKSCASAFILTLESHCSHT